MEALTAVAVAALTIYDMVKAVDKAMVIGDIRLMFKSGGRTGTYQTGARIGLKIGASIGICLNPNPTCNHEHRRRRHQPGCRLGDAAALRRPARAATFPTTPFSTPGIATRCGGCCPRRTPRSRRSSTATSFRRATRLRWVQSPAVGVGSLMFPELLASPVVVTSARGIRARAIAEHVIGVTIALARQLPLAMRAQVGASLGAGRARGAGVDVRTLQGQRMGIVGLGAIGIEVARIAAPFGIRVIGDPPPRRIEPVPPGVDDVWPPDRLADLLAAERRRRPGRAAHAGDASS